MDGKTSGLPAKFEKGADQRSKQRLAERDYQHAAEDANQAVEGRQDVGRGSAALDHRQHNRYRCLLPDIRRIAVAVSEIRTKAITPQMAVEPSTSTAVLTVRARVARFAAASV